MEALGITLAAVVGFVLSFVFYAVAPVPAPSDARPKPWQIAVELLRSATVAGLATGLMSVAGWEGAGAGALLGLALWSLPVVLLTGSVVWEGVPVRSAAPHVVDWLLKLVAIGAVIGSFV